MKTYAPRGLHGAMLRDLMVDLQATPAEVAKHLHVTERSVWRWLADDSAPYAVLAALWHETPKGRETGALDVGNELVLHRGLARSAGDALANESARLARLVAISDTGAANDPLMTGPHQSVDTLMGFVGAGLRIGGTFMQPAQVIADGRIRPEPGAQADQHLQQESRL